jgi:hypothetical protein
MARGFDQRAGELVVVDVSGLAAVVADQEDAIMAAARVRVGDIGVGAFDPAGEVGGNEQVENAVNRIGRDPLAACFRDRLGNVVGRGRAALLGQRTEHFAAHPGPLLAGIDQRRARGIDQAGAGRFVVMVVVVCSSHCGDIGARRAGSNS